MTTGRINQVTAALLRRGDPADVTGNCCRRVPLPAPGGTLAREQALTFARGEHSHSPPNPIAILTHASACNREVLACIALAGYPRGHPQALHSLRAFPRHGEGRLQTPIDAHAFTGRPGPQRQQPYAEDHALQSPIA